MNKLLTSAVLGLIAIPAFAIPNPIPEAKELPMFDQFDVNIPVPSYSDRVIYRFTPEESGVMTVLSVTNNSEMDLFVSELYDSSNYTVVAERWHLGTFSDNVPEGYKFAYEYKMNPDQVFYISLPLTSFNKTTEVKFLWEATEVSPAAIKSILPDPTEDTYYNYLNEQNIVVTADGPMTSFGEITISYLNEVVQIHGSHIAGPPNGEFLTIATAEPGAPNYVYPAIVAGAESFTITVKDYKVNGIPVTGNITGNPNVSVDNGTVSFTYKITKAAEYVASQSVWPSVIYSSWQKGDPAGMITLAFNQPISFAGEATLIMAVYNLGETGSEIPPATYSLPTKVDGNKVIIDLTGQNFAYGSDEVTVLITNIRGANGLPVAFENNNTATAIHLPFADEPAPENPNIPSTPEYMSGEATQMNYEITETDSAVLLMWPETVTLVDADALEIPVYYNDNLIGKLSATYLNLVPGGSSDPALPATRAFTGDKGSMMYVLLGASGLLDAAGEYSFTLPEGMVMNAEGAVNRTQTINVAYVAAAEGVVSPEDGYIFKGDEDVVITIAFDGLIEQNYSPDAPVTITDYADYDVALTWTPGILYIEGNKIVVNLGQGLEPGTYYLSLRESQIVVDGAGNAPIYDYMFVVTSETSGIDAIKADSKKEIYNLNGVRVNENSLKAGVYIINGKKVVVK